MPDEIYWRDSLAWSEQQAGLLQRLARGERVNDEIDWENVVEEVLSVGRSEMHAAESLLMRGLEHIMKVHAWPRSRSVNHWKIEALTFLFDAERQLSPSMRNRIELPRVYRRAALTIAKFRIDRSAPVPIPTVCPFTLADLVPPDDGEPDIDALVAKLGQ